MIAPGTFIVIEGIDAAGTTTQTQRLADKVDERYNDNNQYPTPATHTTKEPTDGPIGNTITTALTGRVAINDISLALLFAADRVDHLKTTITPLLKDGHIVISDRYYHSSFAYQQMNDQLTADWIQTINTHAQTPDITIFLDISVEESIRRITNGQPEHTAEKFEQKQTLKRVKDQYRDILNKLKNSGETIVIIDGEQSREAVQTAIQEALRTNLDTI